MALQGGTFTYNEDLSRFVDRHMSPDVSDSSLFKTAALEYLWKNKEEVTGERVEWAIMTGDDSNGENIFFTIFDGGGSDSPTATEVDNYLVCQSDFKNAGRKIKLSKMKIKRASGKEARVNYVKQATRSRVAAIMQGMNRAFFTGDPTLSGNPQYHGFDATIDFGVDTTTYAERTRSDSRGLVGNLLSAGYTTTANLSQTGSTATNGSTAVTLGGAQTWAIGDEVRITNGSTGNTRIYYATNAGAAATALTISSNYEDPTNASCTVVIESPFNLAKYGTANELTLPKVHKTFSTTVDGTDAANLGICHSRVWNELRQLVLDTERSISKSDLNRLGTAGHTNFLVLDMPIVVDNNAPLDRLYMLNLDYWGLKCLKGYGAMNLSEAGLIDVATVDSTYQTVVGEVVTSAELCCNGINRQAILSDITIG